MNNSSTTDLLQRLSDEKAILHIPAFIFIGLLMFTGFIGNAFVCYFYGCKAKVTPTACFIVGLGILDLISCTVLMPIEIVDIRFFYMFPDAITCKLLRTLNAICTISSVIILVAIATERFRRICRPFKTQITILQAKLICIISTLTAFAISWPGFFLFSVVPVDIPLHGLNVIQGYDCTTVMSESLRIYLLLLSALNILLFVSSTVAISVLYFFVYRELVRRQTFRQWYNSPIERSNQHKISHKIDIGNNEVSISNITWEQNNDTEIQNNIPKEITNVQTKNYKLTKEIIFGKEHFAGLVQDKALSKEENHVFVEATKQSDIVSQRENEIDSLEFSEIVETMYQNEGQCDSEIVETLHQHERQGDGENERKYDKDRVSLTKALRKSTHVSSSTRKKSTDINTDKYTTIMFLVSVIFVVSFLPFICLSMWQSFSLDYLVKRMTDWQLVLFTIGIHSYFLNSAINPFIYGFFNSEFREFFANVLICAFRCRKDRKP